MDNITPCYLIYTDGGSSNITHAACAFIITDANHQCLYTNAFYLGPLTNNCAEYNAIIYSLISALSMGIKSDVLVISDSELVINQINGTYKTNALHLIPYNNTVIYLSKSIKNITFKWRSREDPWIGKCDKMCDNVIREFTR